MRWEGAYRCPNVGKALSLKPTLATREFVARGAEEVIKPAHDDLLGGRLFSKTQALNCGLFALAVLTQFSGEFFCR